MPGAKGRKVNCEICGKTVNSMGLGAHKRNAHAPGVKRAAQANARHAMVSAQLGTENQPGNRPAGINLGSSSLDTIRAELSRCAAALAHRGESWSNILMEVGRGVEDELHHFSEDEQLQAIRHVPFTIVDGRDPGFRASSDHYCIPLPGATCPRCGKVGTVENWSRNLGRPQ